MYIEDNLCFIEIEDKITKCINEIQQHPDNGNNIFF